MCWRWSVCEYFPPHLHLLFFHRGRTCLLSFVYSVVFTCLFCLNYFSIFFPLLRMPLGCGWLFPTLSPHDVQFQQEERSNREFGFVHLFFRHGWVPEWLQKHVCQITIANLFCFLELSRTNCLYKTLQKVFCVWFRTAGGDKRQLPFL